METNKKEERSEYIGMYVTPSVHRELKAASNNKDLEEEIIKKFIKQETSWLESEMKDIDEATIKYKAKLITIKDNFIKAQDAYSDEIGILCDKTFHAFMPIENKFNGIKKQIESIKSEVETTSKLIDSLVTKISYINYDRLTKLLDAIDHYNKMSDKEKELVSLLLKS